MYVYFGCFTWYSFYLFIYQNEIFPYIYVRCRVQCFICLITWMHTQTHTRQVFSGRGIGPSQRPLLDNSQHSCFWRDLNPQPQQASGRKPTPQTAQQPRKNCIALRAWKYPGLKIIHIGWLHRAHLYPEDGDRTFLGDFQYLYATLHGVTSRKPAVSSPHLSFFIEGYFFNNVITISGFHSETDETCLPLGYYVASSGNALQTFRDNLSVPSSRSSGTD